MNTFMSPRLTQLIEAVFLLPVCRQRAVVLSERNPPLPLVHAAQLHKLLAALGLRNQRELGYIYIYH